MKILARSIVTILCLNCGFYLGNDAMADELQVGDTAPEFELKGSDGNTYKLSEYNGKKAVIIAWFPKAFTGG